MQQYRRWICLAYAPDNSWLRVKDAMSIDIGDVGGSVIRMANLCCAIGVWLDESSSQRRNGRQAADRRLGKQHL